MKQKNASLAIVVSRFNTDVSQRLLDGALLRLKELKFPDESTPVFTVPGAIEIPLIAQSLAKTQNYDAIICLGTVIQGDTDHYTYVCESVTHGCQQVALSTGVPIIFGVLTTKTKEQALERAGGAQGNKGSYSVDAALEMVSIIRDIQLKRTKERVHT